MPVPGLVTTIGGATSNSYISLAEADSFFEARLDGDSWPTFSNDKRTQALLKATKRLGQLDWLGSRVNTVQALAWPRIGVPKRDSADVYTYGGYYGSLFPAYGEHYKTDEIPQQIKDAECEFAFAYLNSFNDGEEPEVKSFSDDKMSVTFDQPRIPGDMPAEVERLIAGLINETRLMRG